MLTKAILYPVDYFTLRRFLRARTYDLEKATTMWMNHLAWKSEFKVDTILQDFYFDERDQFLVCYPQGYHKIDKVVGAWTTARMVSVRSCSAGNWTSFAPSPQQSTTNLHQLTLVVLAHKKTASHRLYRSQLGGCSPTATPPPHLSSTLSHLPTLVFGSVQGSTGPLTTTNHCSHASSCCKAQHKQPMPTSHAPMLKHGPCVGGLNAPRQRMVKATCVQHMSHLPHTCVSRGGPSTSSCWGR